MSFTANPSGVPFCDYCQVAYGPPNGECARCGTPHALGDRRCSNCDAELARECPVCGTLNPLEVRTCLVCRHGLTGIDKVFARLATGTPGQLRSARELGTQVKAKEEAASEARLAKMWAEEERRQAELVRQRTERQRRERLMITTAIGIAAVVVVVAIIAAVIISGSSPALMP